MPDSLVNLLRFRTVLVTTGSQKGTGAFIAPGKILTCAHVVRDCAEQPGDISITYHEAQKDGSVREASVAVKSLILSAKDNHDEYPDIAILHVDITDHPILRLPETDTLMEFHRQKSYLAFGFQRTDRISGKAIPQAISLNYEGEDDANDKRRIIFEDGRIAPGMSGAPMVERDRGIITGIVQMTRDRNSNLGAYVIPVDMIFHQFRTWTEGNTDDIHATLSSRRFRRSVDRQYARAYPRFTFYRKNWHKLVAMVLFLFGLLWWTFQNLGQIQDSAWLAALLIALPFIGNLASRSLGRQATKESADLFQSASKLLLHPATITLLAVPTIYLWMFWTSIWIDGNPENRGLQVTIFSDAVADKTYQDSLNRDGEAHFLVRTDPLTKLVYYIQVAGREPLADTVSVGQKLELSYPYDFRIEPVVLVKLKPERIDRINAQYRPEVFVNGKKIDPGITSLDGYGGILLGKRSVNYDVLEADWVRRYQLDENDKNVQRVLTLWKRPFHHQIDLDEGFDLKVKLIHTDTDSAHYQYNAKIDRSFSDIVLVN